MGNLTGFLTTFVSLCLGMPDLGQDPLLHSPGQGSQREASRASGGWGERRESKKMPP